MDSSTSESLVADAPRPYKALKLESAQLNASTVSGHPIPPDSLHGKPCSSDTVGRLSFAPATHTTVVTTTTTTTTSFPPLVMKAPRHLSARDPEQYPLAFSPTPHAIKRVRLDIGGRHAYFEEADDPVQKFNEYSEQEAQLHANHGIIISPSRPTSGVQSRSSKRGGSAAHRADSAVDNETQALRNRSATPISISDATELNSFHRRNRKAVNGHRRFANRPSSATAPGPSPDFSSENEGFEELASLFDSSLDVQTNSFASRTPVETQRQDLGISSFDKTQLSNTSSGGHSSAPSSSLQAPFADLGTDVSAPAHNSQPFSRSSVPIHLDTSPANDASLPSPSLSPITAAANLQRSLSASRAAINTSAELHGLAKTSSGDRSVLATPDSNSRSIKLAGQSTGDQDDLLGSSSTGPFAGIPAMLNSFDEMPTEMKTYVMFHLLKRCAKPTLQFVAEAVDPAMRCDYLGRLPLELSLNITQYLDARSMCNAAQVCKRWRLIVDSDETAWKALTDNDGFHVSRNEIEKAVMEGWGWRIKPTITRGSSNDTIPHGHTKRRSLHTTPPDQSTSLSLGDGFTPRQVPPSAPMKRKRPSEKSEQDSEKRRTVNGPSPKSPPGLKNKKLKRKAAPEGPNVALMELMDRAAGPNVLANAAACAIANPKIGLPSLQNLHFHKSIYQKHYVMRQNWMKPATEPLHLAFKAHQRHVVTCLQFDDDKILTGSDDSFIDVYDTKTGASIRRLTGHDGGVWALEYQGDLLVSGSTDRSVRVWDMRDGRLLHTFQGHTSTVRCLQILQPVKVGKHADGKPIMMPRYPLIITGSRDSSCRVWRLPKLGDRPMSQSTVGGGDPDNPYFLRALFGHTNSVRAIAAYGDTLVSGSYDTFVRVWKISTGECLHRLHGHSSKVYSVVLDNKRNRCISGSMDNMVKVWSLESGTCLFNLDGHTSLVGLLDLRDDHLVSAAADATLRVWDPATGDCKHQLTAHTGAITCFLHDGQKIISGSDRTLKMWDTKTGECVRDLLTDLSGVWQIKFDERRCIAAVQRDDWTYIEVLDFGMSQDEDPVKHRGRRVIVDARGREISDDETDQHNALSSVEETRNRVEELP